MKFLKLLRWTKFVLLKIWFTTFINIAGETAERRVGAVEGGSWEEASGDVRRRCLRSARVDKGTASWGRSHPQGVLPACSDIPPGQEPWGQSECLRTLVQFNWKTITYLKKPIRRLSWLIVYFCWASMIFVNVWNLQFPSGYYFLFLSFHSEHSLKNVFYWLSRLKYIVLLTPSLFKFLVFGIQTFIFWFSIYIHGLFVIGPVFKS